MPLGALLKLAALVLETLISRQGEVGHGHAAGQQLYFRVFADVAYKDDFVDASRHNRFSPDRFV